jgi:hypothetical protein
VCGEGVSQKKKATNTDSAWCKNRQKKKIVASAGTKKYLAVHKVVHPKHIVRRDKQVRTIGLRRAVGRHTKGLDKVVALSSLRQSPH